MAETAMKAKTSDPEYIELKESLPRAIQETFLDGCIPRVVSATDLNHVAIGADALGVQLMIEMRDCLTERLDDLEWVKRVMVEAAIRDASVVGITKQVVNSIRAEDVANDDF